MKILYFYPNSGSFTAKWQLVHVLDELKHYDIHFELFNPWNYNSYDDANEALMKRLREDHSIDLFMNCAGSYMLFPETMKVIKSLPVPKLLICFDNLHAPFMHKSIAPYFDLVWLTSWETEPMFQRWGCNTIFLPYAANPYAFKDFYTTNVNKVCFIGTPYGTRTMMFNTLTKGDIDVDVFCKSDSLSTAAKTNNHPTEIKTIATRLQIVSQLLSFSIGRKVLYSGIKSHLLKSAELIDSSHLSMFNNVSYEEMNRIYAEYALSLNIITLRNTTLLKHPLHKIHLRTFEIPMSYGLELTEYNEELEEYFSDNEMVFYRDKAEMIEKARFYTNPSHASICRKMKLNARRRAANEHGWMNRFSAALDKLGLKYQSVPDVPFTIG